MALNQQVTPSQVFSGSFTRLRYNAITPRPRFVNVKSASSHWTGKWIEVE